MTKLLAAHDHKISSVIRNPDHAIEISDQYPENRSLIEPVVASIEETDEEGAKELMKGVEWVIWSAGKPQNPDASNLSAYICYRLL